MMAALLDLWAGLFGPGQGVLVEWAVTHVLASRAVTPREDTGGPTEAAGEHESVQTDHEGAA